jgi:hypothetical protein
VAGALALVAAARPWGSYESFGHWLRFTSSGPFGFDDAVVVMIVGLVVLLASVAVYRGRLSRGWPAGLLLVSAIVVAVVAAHATDLLYVYAHPPGQKVSPPQVGSRLLAGMWLLYASSTLLLVAFVTELLHVGRSVRTARTSGLRAAR